MPLGSVYSIEPTTPEDKMKSRTSIAATLAASLLATVIVAGPALGKGKPPKTGESCKPQVSLNLKGTVAGTPGADSFQMNVTRANHHGSALVSATPLTIKVNAATTIKRKGPQNSLAALVSSDRVQVQYRICKADFASLTPTSFNASTTLFAKRVDAHPAHLA
jgi:hypothetical protein